jgi:hypothetical protein
MSATFKSIEFVEFKESVEYDSSFHSTDSPLHELKGLYLKNGGEGGVRTHVRFP